MCGKFKIKHFSYFLHLIQVTKLITLWVCFQRHRNSWTFTFKVSKIGMYSSIFLKYCYIICKSVPLLNLNLVWICHGRLSKSRMKMIGVEKLTAMTRRFDRGGSWWWGERDSVCRQFERKRSKLVLLLDCIPLQLRHTISCASMTPIRSLLNFWWYFYCRPLVFKRCREYSCLSTLSCTCKWICYLDTLEQCWLSEGSVWGRKIVPHFPTVILSL